MSTEKNKTSVTGVILAGGMGRRLGGTDKGLLRKQGKHFVAHIIDALSPQVDQLLIIANRNHETYSQYGAVSSDEISGYQGPLAGMQAAIRQCKTTWIATVPCDGYQIPADYVERLTRSAKQNNCPIAVAFDGHRLQPVHALIHCSLIDSLDEYLQGGERKIDRWYATAGYVNTDFSDQLQLFDNINTPQDKQEQNAE